MLGTRRWGLTAFAALGVAATGCSEKAEDGKDNESAPKAEQTGRAPVNDDTKPAARVDPRVTVKVDPRVELLSIVCRLAGYPSYNHEVQTPYTKKVDAHFAQFETHDAVGVMRDLRAKEGISYDAPFRLAVHLDGVPSLRPIAPLDPFPAELDQRWKNVPMDKLTEVLRRFVADSKFDEFFAANAEFYKNAEDVYRRFAAEKNALAWYDGFFGRKIDSPFVIVPGLLTGKMAYGASATDSDGTQTFYQAMIAFPVDDRGLPTIGDDQEAFLVHEMAHPQVNPAVEAHRAAFEPAAAKAFAKMRPKLPKMYNDWQIMINESVVRAIVVLYINDRHGKDAANAEARKQMNEGFAWIGEFSLALKELKESGTPWTPADAMPKLVKALGGWVAKNVE